MASRWRPRRAATHRVDRARRERVDSARRKLLTKSGTLSLALLCAVALFAGCGEAAKAPADTGTPAAIAPKATAPAPTNTPAAASTPEPDATKESADAAIKAASDAYSAVKA